LKSQHHPIIRCQGVQTRTRRYKNDGSPIVGNPADNYDRDAVFWNLLGQ
jgi:hypothetical protein